MTADLASSSDDRAKLFWTTGHTYEMTDYKTWTNGYPAIKFTNNNVVPTPELWQYDFVDALNPSYPGMGYIQKTTPSGTNILNPDEVKFDGNSGFIVIGAPLGSADHIQPYIIIKFSGFIYYKNELVTPFYLETAVSQRLIDTLP